LNISSRDVNQCSNIIIVFGLLYCIVWVAELVIWDIVYYYSTILYYINKLSIITCMGSLKFLALELVGLLIKQPNCIW
jgi:hypothetical protein